MIQALELDKPDIEEVTKWLDLKETIILDEDVDSTVNNIKAQYSKD